MSLSTHAHLIELQERFRPHAGGAGLVAIGYGHWPLGQIAALLRVINYFSIRIDWRHYTEADELTCWLFEMNRPARRALLALAASSPRQKRLAAILPTLHDLLSVSPRARWLELRFPAPECPDGCQHCEAYEEFLIKQRPYWDAE